MNKLAIFIALLFVFSLSGLTGRTNLVSAASGACTAPATDYGTVSGLSVTTSGSTTHIWSRMAIANTSDNNYLLEIDDASDNALDCYTVSAGAGAVYADGASEHFNSDSSNWVDTSVPASGTGSLPAGTYHVKLIGNAPDVLVDRLILAQDGTCTPVGTGDNCVAPPDTTDPTASITSPANNATVSGTVSVSATASDDTGVTKVEFYVDGNDEGSDSSSPYSYSLDTTGLTNDSHSVQAIAYDAALNSGSDTITINVSNAAPPPDTTKPSVSLSSVPAILNKDSTGSPYNSASYTVTATASDASGIENVVFKLDGAVEKTDTSSPYSVSLDIRGLSCASHSISATATDNSSNHNSQTASSNTKVTYGADITGDCSVNYLDLNSLAVNYNKSGGGVGRADINGDGQVNYLDLNSLAVNYNK